MNGIKISVDPQSVTLSANPAGPGVHVLGSVVREVTEPYIKVEETEDGAVITCTDPDGETTATVYNGQDGVDGKDGSNGSDGKDGISPTVSVTDIEGGHTVSITDANGTQTFTVLDGQNGAAGSPGQDGAPGAGIAAGGVAGNVLKKKSATDYDTEWSNEWMFIASYGKTTYADVLAAYQSNRIIYCRASSNNNPGTGNQLRMAFLAYINNEATPTEFEFQYYRSVSTHSDSQQGDQVFVYKLKQASGWEVTTRNSYTKIAAGTGLSSSYSNGTLTLSLS